MASGVVVPNNNTNNILDRSKAIDIKLYVTPPIGSYTCPCKGVVCIVSQSVSGGDSWYLLKTSFDPSFIYQRSVESSYPNIQTTERIVNGGEVLVFDSWSNRQVNYATFIPLI